MANLSHVADSDTQCKVSMMAKRPAASGMFVLVQQYCWFTWPMATQISPELSSRIVGMLTNSDMFRKTMVALAPSVTGNYCNQVAAVAANGRNTVILCRGKISRQSNFTVNIFNTYVLSGMSYTSHLWMAWGQKFGVSSTGLYQKDCNLPGHAIGA